MCVCVKLRQLKVKQPHPWNNSYISQVLVWSLLSDVGVIQKINFLYTGLIFTEDIWWTYFWLETSHWRPSHCSLLRESLTESVYLARLMRALTHFCLYYRVRTNRYHEFWNNHFQIWLWEFSFLSLIHNMVDYITLHMIHYTEIWDVSWVKLDSSHILFSIIFWVWVEQVWNWGM